MQYVNYTKRKRIANEMAKLTHFMTNNDVCTKTLKTTTKQNSKPKNPCQNRESNSGPHAAQSAALPLGHRDKKNVIFILAHCMDLPSLPRTLILHEPHHA